MGWAENIFFPKRIEVDKVPVDCQIVFDDENWIIERRGNEVRLVDETGNSYRVDSLGKCFVTEGPMRDIFGQIKDRVEIPDPFCECLREVIREVSVRQLE